jgi:hypothetical protein
MSLRDRRSSVRSSAIRADLVLVLSFSVLVFSCSTATTNPIPPATTSVMVDCQTGNVPVRFDEGMKFDHDIIVCNGAHILWTYTGANTKPLVVIQFAPDDSPFSKRTFSSADGTPIDSGGISAPANSVKSYKYTLSLDDQAVDPHVIVLGGNGKPPQTQKQ